MRRIGVGLVGLGNVGSGVVRLLAEHADLIATRLGASLEVSRLAVRDPRRQRSVSVDSAIVTDDWREVIAARDVRIVVELVGGLEPARSIVLAALKAGKHVVTANKALLAEHGDEIFAAAEQASVEICYEAAVAGGLPILRSIREGLAADRIEGIWGIVNGTSNYILTRMEQGGGSFDDVLREAQSAGYAEADPTLDVSGTDAAHKLAILITLAFGARIRSQQIFTRGVSILEPDDLHWAERFGFRIRHLAIAKDHGDAIEARVHPTLVPSSWMLAAVTGPLNAVYTKSRALGPSLYYGPGAGGFSTAVAVLGDMIEVGRGLLAFSSTAPGRAVRQLQNRPIREMGDLECRYYLRLDCADQPGVLAKVTGVLAAQQISIAEIVQQKAQTDRATLVVLTHRARERDVQAARSEIARLDVIAGRAKLLRIEE